MIIHYVLAREVLPPQAKPYAYEAGRGVALREAVMTTFFRQYRIVGITEAP